MSDAASALDVRGVAKSFGGHRALDGVSVSVAAGACTALLGPSGSGKTTLLRVIAGLETADGGTVTIAGRTTDDPAQRVPPERRGIGLLFQDLALWPHMTLRRNVEFVLEMRKLARSAYAQEVASAAASAGLPQTLLDRRPSDVSGGERQRAALARLLAQAPAAALLDEPLSHLDPDLRASLVDLLRGLRRERRLAMLLVTHDHAEAFALADRIVVLRAGRVEQEGTPEDVYRAPRSRFVAEFVGRATVVPAERRGSRMATPLGEFDAPAGSVSGPLLAVFRPEAFRPGGSLRGRIADGHFAGGHWLALVDVPSSQGNLRLAVKMDEPPVAGAEIGLAAAAPAWVPQETS